VIADYSYGDAIDAYVQHRAGDGSDAVQAVSGEYALELNVRKLLAGRIDAVIEGRMVMTYQLTQTNRSDTLKEAGKAGSDPVYIASSPQLKQSEEFARILSDAVQELRETEKLQKILAKYGVQDWK